MDARLKKVSAEEVFELLVNQDQLLKKHGLIRFYLGDVNIQVRQKDVVGNIIQEWLEGWFKHNRIIYAVNENTQMPPDFFLDPDDKTKELLEVKAFDYSRGPGFDIADFRMYVNELIEKPYMLNAYYLIFAYEMSDIGNISIKGLWLKRVWEITRRMEKWPLNLQVKRDVVHKIRPCRWYSSRKGKYFAFNSKEDFLSALEETIYQNPDTRNMAGTWKQQFLSSYEDHYGETLTIPRWSEIQEKYVTKSRD